MPSALNVLSPISNLFTRKKGKDRDRGEPRPAGRGGGPFKPRPKPAGGDRDEGEAPKPAGRIASFKRGGKMKKRGVAKLHKGERIEGKKRRGRSRGR